MTHIFAVVATMLALVEADRDCAGLAQTLTWECGGVCDEYIPCLVYNASDCDASSGEHSANCTNDEDGVCAYACFTNFYTYYGETKFLVPFGDSSSSSSRVTASESELTENAWVYEDAITSIGIPSIEPDTVSVRFVGGTTYFTNSQGVPATVTLADGFLIDNDTVTEVEMSYIDLSHVGDLLRLLPDELSELTAIGSGLATFKAGKGQGLNLTSLSLGFNSLTTCSGDFPVLETLSLGFNLLTNFSGEYPALTTLDLDNNSLENFTGNFPALTSLTLTNNLLATVPDAVFNISTLTELYLAGNPFNGMPTFTRKQVTFLQGLRRFDLQAVDFAEAIDCGNAANAYIFWLNVCVLDEVKDSSSSLSGGTVAGLAVGAGVVVVVFLVWRRRSRSADKGGPRRQDLLTADLTQGSENGGPWSDEWLTALRVEARDIEDVRKLASGAFGEVWLVRYQSTKLLASKRLLVKHGGGKTLILDRLLRFIEEIKLVSTLQHTNIAAVVGVAWTFHSDIQALFEYVKNGDLRDYLIKNKPNSALHYEEERLSAEAFKLQVACDIVDALVYVHSFAPPVVHRDLKSRNVLLTSDWRAKVTDFGSARVQSENATMTAGVGTGRWLAPEVLTGSNDYGAPADIYAFGVILSELDTHLIPYDDARSTDGQRPLANVAILQLVAEGKLRPTFSASCRPATKELAVRCMAQVPEDRPSAALIAYELRQVLKVVQAAAL